MGTGCDPRDVDETEASDFARFVGKVSAAAATEAWRTMRTPPAQIKERDELPPLHVQAERKRQEAIAEGRCTPRPAANDDVERARAERIARAAADEETRLEIRRAAKRNKPEES
jgi:hypothetical protein